MSTDSRSNYVVTAVRDEDGWWFVEVPDVDGAMTQASRLDQVEEVARDVVSLLLQVPPDSFDLVVKPQLPEPLASRVAEAQELRQLAEKAQLEAAAVTRPLIGELATAGFRVREIGQLVGITYQRAAQLAAEARASMNASAESDGPPASRRRATRRRRVGGTRRQRPPRPAVKSS